MYVPSPPAFIVFCEFDNTPNTQRLYVVYVDHELITKVLKRMHKIEQSDKDNEFHERKMTIKYDDTHRISNLSGAALKEVLIKHKYQIWNQWRAFKILCHIGWLNIKDVIQSSLKINRQLR